MLLTRDRRRLPIVGALLATTLTIAIAGCSSSGGGKTNPGSLAHNASLKGATFTVGSKEFTEQLVLCHITSLALRSVGATVKEKCGISGSNTTRAALTSGSIDMYWEYTGTAWINYLKQTKPINDATAQYDAVAKDDLAQNHVTWLTPAPANNTYAIAVKASAAKELNVASLSDYAQLARTDASKASICVASEFAGRDDGWPGLEKAYGFSLAESNVATLAEGAIYNSVAKKNPCSFGEADTTDGRLQSLDLTVLTDDKHFFPVYNPALTLRESVLKDHPDVAKVMNPIALALTTSELLQLNGDVDVKGQEPANVAEDWLKSKGFIGS